MKTDFNLIKRFLSDTPDFWKRVDFIGLLLIALATLLHDLGVDALIVSVVGAIGGTLALVSKFAVKDIAILQSSTDALDAAGKMLPEIRQQANAVIRTMQPLTNEFKKAGDSQPGPDDQAK